MSLDYPVASSEGPEQLRRTRRPRGYILDWCPESVAPDPWRSRERHERQTLNIP
jgi:hypothetical protein